MNQRYQAKAAAIVAMVVVLTVVAACQLDSESDSTAEINVAGMSAGNAALFGVAQGSQQRASFSLNLDGQGEIHVSGQGKASIEPDLAILNLGVEALRETVSEAREEAATAMEAVMESLSENGVEERDIQTQRFDIRSEYNYRSDARELIGYTVNNSLTVKVRDLDSVAAVIDGAAEAGGDNIRFNGLRFAAEDLSPAMAQLREDAVADAKGKAQHFADLAGVGLGDLIFISDGTVASPLTVRAESAVFGYGAQASPAASTAISRGELDVSLTVQTVFAIE